MAHRFFHGAAEAWCSVTRTSTVALEVALEVPVRKFCKRCVSAKALRAHPWTRGSLVELAVSVVHPSPRICYFVGPVTPEFLAVKIGYTGLDPNVRLKSLRNGSPVELGWIVTLAGGAALEGCLHGAFYQHQLHGEWFRWGLHFRDFLLDALFEPRLALRRGPLWNLYMGATCAQVVRT